MVSLRTIGIVLPTSLLVFVLLVIMSSPYVGEYIRRKTKRRSARKRKILLRSLHTAELQPCIIGFFHPYCNAGGGGERVLWAAIRATQHAHPNVMCVVYTGDLNVDQEQIVLRTKDAFGIELDPSRLHIIHLLKRHLVSPESWPRFTLIGQSLGSIPLVFEAINDLAPDIFIDTMGYAFTYPLVYYLLGIPIATYTHYPTISGDMLSAVSSKFLFKRLYWRAFAVLYSYVGSYADIVMANSTWTMNHLKDLWSLKPDQASIIYPPCDTTALSGVSTQGIREKQIVCVAQFRAEKDHATLLQAFNHLIYDLDTTLSKDARLILVGTVRNQSDRDRVAALENIAIQLGIRDSVTFLLDAPWPMVMDTLSKAWIGTNAMWNEHFGIGVVEYMAAGLIAVVHDSAGPKLDIVTPFEGQITGFHATDAMSFAKAYARAFSLPDAECLSMRRRAQLSSARFSVSVFEKQWEKIMIKLLRLEKRKRMR